MHETDFQSHVTEAIIHQKTGEVSVGLTDNEKAVVVEIDNGEDAAYTAEEARELAQAIQCVSDQRWERDADDLIEYIRDVADVVDSDKVAEDIESKWNL